MTRLAFCATVLAGFLLARWLCPKKTQPSEPVDRFDLAGMDERMKQYDRDFDANNRLRRR